MSYKDTLTLYEELVATGVPDAQAKIQAHQLGALADELNDIGPRLDKIDANMKWMMLIGGVMAASFFSNVLFLKFG